MSLHPCPPSANGCRPNLPRLQKISPSWKRNYTTWRPRSRIAANTSREFCKRAHAVDIIAQNSKQPRPHQQSARGSKSNSGQRRGCDGATAEMQAGLVHRTFEGNNSVQRSRLACQGSPEVWDDPAATPRFHIYQPISLKVSWVTEMS